MKNNPSSLKNFFGMVLFGSIFMLVGCLIVLYSLDIIPSSDANFNAPRWVVAAAGCFFIIAGMMPMLQGLKSLTGNETHLFRMANSAVSFLFLLLLAVPFNWVAFGLGVQEFSNDVSIGGLVTLFFDELSTMRCVFGVFAMLINFMLVYAVGYSIWKLISPDAADNNSN